MFRIIPAIDLIEGRGVRLEQGDFSKETVYASNPVEQALKFERMGLRDLHLVDLDGTRSKRLEHQGVLHSVSQATSLHLDYGGGVRNEEDIELLLSLGASKVVLGSAAALRPDWFVKTLQLIGSKNLVFSCDIRNKKLQLSGWQSSFSGDFWSLLDQFSKAGLQEVQCTAIDRDGMLKGPDFELYEEAIRRFPQLNWIASGGVSRRQDLIDLEALGCSGAIVGKAFYEGRITEADLKLWTHA
ncbi:1-(5-phosphoribosyl)-5-[(5-phosphoribosylamino)methylideneamino] imidazole-4-carboxamide isomerase [Cryomorphaceae bacterium]|nr:1-(5-phosphoribosyl)-5-[(5-phosphoribosylamino)methylideneamino] imidazole-4-carboxamide isomerase [Cryomorphaceae bacterium]